MRTPPLAAGMPLFGNALNMINDPLAYLVESYHQYGSVFRLRVLGREAIVLAGLEANRLVMSMGADLAKGGIYTGFSDELGQDAHFSSVDGEAHHKLRRAARSGYSKHRYHCHLPQLIEIIRARTSRWQPGDIVPVVATMEQLIGELLGTLLTQHPVGTHFDDFSTVIKTLHYVYPMRVMPKFMLAMPNYKNAKKRIFAFAEQIIAHHVDNPSISRNENLVDDLITAYEQDKITHEQLIGQIFTPYFVGIDTVGATISFLTYLILSHKSVLQAVLSEVDAAFADDTINFDALPTLKNAINETLRLYPIAPFLARRAMKSFSFAGYDIPEGSELIMATGVTHYLPEFYPEPHKFNVKRQHDVPAGAFTTWGLGAHSCLGAGLAEMLMQVIITTLLHDWQFDLHPMNYEMKISLTPIPNPGDSLKIKVRGLAL